MHPVKEVFDLNTYIMHHVLNSNEWHLPFLPPIPLPEYITLHGLMVIIWSFAMLLIFGFLYQKNARVPTGMTNALEAIIIFIRNDISIAFLGEEDGKRMAPLFITFFFFILGLNLMGLIPIFSTATSNINVTGALALVTFIFMVFGAIYKNGLFGFLKAFIPPGVPKPILLLLFPIEFIGIFIKSGALMIRLFANMLAGHIVILAMLGLVVTIGAWALPAVFLAIGVYGLEVMVVFLQAFVFTLLSAIFIGQTWHPEH
jgi:F-type H+-transporting ATPase subunit a